MKYLASLTAILMVTLVSPSALAENPERGRTRGEMQLQIRLGKMAEAIQRVESRMKELPSTETLDAVWKREIDELEQRLLSIRRQSSSLETDSGRRLYARAVRLAARLSNLSLVLVQERSEWSPGEPVQQRQLTSAGAPSNDLCSNATAVGLGIFSGDMVGATLDGTSTCAPGDNDIWFRFVAPSAGRYVFSVTSTGYFPVVSLHSSCPGVVGNQLACSEDPEFSEIGGVILEMSAGMQVKLRVTDEFFDMPSSVTLSIRRATGLTGTVTAEGSPLSWESVTILDEAGDWVTSSYADSEGRWYALDLVPGTYYAWVQSYSYLSEVYDDEPCPSNNNCDPLQGTPIQVAPDRLVGSVDFDLTRGSTLRGSVVKATNGRALGACVSIWSPDGDFLDEGCSDHYSGGIYQIGFLREGRVYATAHSYDGLPSVVYDGIQCEDPCDPLLGDSILLREDEVTEGVDFVMDDSGACLEDDITLCIDDEDYQPRFRVTAHVETDLGGGLDLDAGAVSLDYVDVQQGGLFYFRNRANPELLVKVLDGCLLNNHFWVFYSAATNLGFTLTVVDTETGVSKTYVNPDQTNALTVTDTQALASCF